MSQENSMVSVVCKICEKFTKPKKLVLHSNKCKETAIAKEKVLSFQETILSLINTAYKLKSQLSTNMALQSAKMKKRSSLEQDIKMSSNSLFSAKSKGRKQNKKQCFSLILGNNNQKIQQKKVLSLTSLSTTIKDNSLNKKEN